MDKSLIVLLFLLSNTVFGQVTLRNASIENASLSKTNAAVVPPSGTEFVVSNIGATPRTDAQANVGYRFAMNANCTVTALTRLVLSGNSLTHTVSIRAWTSPNTVLATGTVSTSGVGAGSFARITITPLAITAGVEYIVVASEGTDTWSDDQLGTLTVTSDGLVNAAVYFDGSTFQVADSGARGFGVPGFEYTIP